MKKLKLAIFLLSLNLPVFSQLEYYHPPEVIGHKAGQVIVSLSPNVLFNTPNGIQMAGGAKIQVFLGKRFSLDGDLMLGRNYMHLSPALVGVPVGLIGLTIGFDSDEDMTLSNLLISIIGLALSFEHFSYHIPLNGEMEISPYVSLLRYKYANLNEDFLNTELVPKNMVDELCFAGGVQLNRYFGRFVVSPYIDYDIGYKNHISGVNTGVYLGFYFRGK